jgi:P-type Ca2+ transporter type 2C
MAATGEPAPIAARAADGDCRQGPQSWSSCGLTSDQAAERLLLHGPNALPRQEHRTLSRIVKGVLTEPMFLLLIGAAVVYLAFGSLAEGLMMILFAGISIGLVVLQEYRGEKALEALLAFAAPTARVLRDGTERVIPARELVPGDALVVFEGDLIAADGRLRDARSIRVDESLLTGESIPVRKIAAAEGGDRGMAMPGGDDQPFVFAGTLMAGGSGLVEVEATGANTRTGRIGLSLASIASEPTPLQRSIAGIVTLFGGFAFAASVVLVLLFGWRTGNWLEGLLSGLALAMAMVPEEFPMVLAIFTVLGARRLARIDVLARHAAAVETLGAVSVLCVDKTGTLTENRIVLEALVTDKNRMSGVAAVGAGQNAAGALDASLAALLAAARRASDGGSADPIDRAVCASAARLIAGQAEGIAGERLEREYPLTPERLAVIRATIDGGGSRRIAAKGAPEAIAKLCRLDEPEGRRIMSRVAQLAAEGLRVLAVAEAAAASAGLPDQPDDFAFRWLGLVAFEDPLRPSVPAAVAEARKAGVTVVMITGDHPATALAIARKAGIAADGEALTGAALDRLDDAALAQALTTVRVFARIMPEQKLRLVKAFVAAGAVVAMTGDGVNDAPALKAAHIGIAMGARGTDVAREAADLILLTEDFDRMIAGIRLGRRIFDNLRKVLLYVTAAHAMIVGLALAPLILGLPPVLFPVHVVIIELVIDTTCSVAFERAPAERDLMTRGPRPIDEPIIGPALVVVGLVQGGLIFAAAFAVYMLALDGGASVEAARSLAFIAMIAGNLTLVRVNMARGWTLPRLLERGQRVTWIILAIAATITAAAVLLPALAQMFRFATPSAAWAMAAVAAGVGSALCFDAIKTIPVVRSSLWRGAGVSVAATRRDPDLI